MEAPWRARRRAPDHLAQEVVQGSQDLPGLGVMTPLLLVHFFPVAAGAVLGGYDHGDQSPIVLESVRFPPLRPVAIKAIHPFLAVLPQTPFLHEGCVLRATALEASLPFPASPGGPLGRGLGESPQENGQERQERKNKQGNPDASSHLRRLLPPGFDC
ncbi:MAG: hypothetical protein HYY65_13000 [Candidatus Tectomicrobia bacterium]|uniref:Uncharacterized protein n=1 Tax=Tectimicrobiota bacterium TaxID=2528274 RepID=A0A932GRJ9_UNCTE|nr:hypothetical protein [Candidatus Tectomicrobia bacterium]